MDLFISSFVSSAPKILHFDSCILLMKLVSAVPVLISNCFYFQNSLSFYFLYWLYFLSQVLNSFIHFLSPLVCFSWISLRDFFNFLFKDLYHLHKDSIKIIFLCFSYVGISMAHCGRVAGFQWRNIALAAIACVFMLVSRHLRLGWL